MITSNRFGALTIERTPNPQSLSIYVYYTQKRGEDSNFPILIGITTFQHKQWRKSWRYGTDPESFRSKNDYTEILNVIEPRTFPNFLERNQLINSPTTEQIAIAVLTQAHRDRVFSDFTLAPKSRSL